MMKYEGQLGLGLMQGLGQLETSFSVALSFLYSYRESWLPPTFQLSISSASDTQKLMNFSC